MRRLAAILLWSVIAAAFIGPGTVTTAAAAGAGFGLALLNQRKSLDVGKSSLHPTFGGFWFFNPYLKLRHG